VRLVASARLAGRLAAPSHLTQKLHRSARERRELNAQTCMTASGIIRQPRCPKLISLLIVFRIRERNPLVKAIGPARRRRGPPHRSTRRRRRRREGSIPRGVRCELACPCPRQGEAHLRARRQAAWKPRRVAHGNYDDGARAGRRLEANAERARATGRQAAGSCGTPSQPVPELTRSAGIQLNERVPLRRKAKAIAWSAPDIAPIRTQHGEAVGRFYSARRLCSSENAHDRKPRRSTRDGPE
jgi:hypothetical protein